MTERQLVSVRVDRTLWREVRMKALEQGVSAESVVERGLRVVLDGWSSFLWPGDMPALAQPGALARAMEAVTRANMEHVEQEARELTTEPDAYSQAPPRKRT